jgi:hypothetical protein
VEFSERDGWVIAAEWVATAVLFAALALVNLSRWRLAHH